MILSRCHSVWDVLNGYRSEYKSTPRLTDHVLVVQLELYWCLPFWRDVAGSKLRREKVVWRRRIHLLRRGCIWYALGCIWSTDTLHYFALSDVQGQSSPLSVHMHQVVGEESLEPLYLSCLWHL